MWISIGASTAWPLARRWPPSWSLSIAAAPAYDRASGICQRGREARSEMGVKLTEEEIDDFLTKGHTLTIATIRKSGEPFMVPIWYVWMDGAFWIRAAAKSPK